MLYRGLSISGFSRFKRISSSFYSENLLLYDRVDFLIFSLVISHVNGLQYFNLLSGLREIKQHFVISLREFGNTETLLLSLILSNCGNQFLLLKFVNNDLKTSFDMFDRF